MRGAHDPRRELHGLLLVAAPHVGPARGHGLGNRRTRASIPCAPTCGSGLIGTQERVELVEGDAPLIDSAPGNGTTVRAELPARRPRSRRRPGAGSAS